MGDTKTLNPQVLSRQNYPQQGEMFLATVRERNSLAEDLYVPPNALEILQIVLRAH